MHEDVKYPDLMVDDAFKLVFGQESTKTVMIEFLNQVIDDFCLKNMHLLHERPKALTHDVFDKIFDTGELIMSSDDLRTLILSKMTTERDLRNQFAYAIKTGLEEGRAEGQAETIRKMLAAGIPSAVIAEALDMTVEDCEAYR